jgi:hypothetical protein
MGCGVCAASVDRMLSTVVLRKALVDTPATGCKTQQLNMVGSLVNNELESVEGSSCGLVNSAFCLDGQKNNEKPQSA